MRLLLVLGLIALSLVTVPVAAASHGCVGSPSAAAACGWHHGPYECYRFYVLGEHQQNWDTC